MTTRVQAFIQATNDFDVEAALALFAPDAVIEDASVGDVFAGHARIRDYLHTFFVDYHTVTTLISEEVSTDRQEARVGFTGDFGQETGVLKMQLDAHGRIVKLEADLD